MVQGADEANLLISRRWPPGVTLALLSSGHLVTGNTIMLTKKYKQIASGCKSYHDNTIHIAKILKRRKERRPSGNKMLYQWPVTRPDHIATETWSQPPRDQLPCPTHFNRWVLNIHQIQMTVRSQCSVRGAITCRAWCELWSLIQFEAKQFQLWETRKITWNGENIIKSYY